MGPRNAGTNRRAGKGTMPLIGDRNFGVEILKDRTTCPDSPALGGGNVGSTGTMHGWSLSAGGSRTRT